MITPTEAYNKAITDICYYGNKIIDENGKLTREIENLKLVVNDPCNWENWPIKGAGWSLPALNTYVEKEILSPDIPGGFRYSYGERLFDYPNCDWNSDQIEYIVKKLIDEPTSRRGIAITYNPNIDMYEDSIPCLQLVEFLIRDEKINMTAVFRSWDVKRAGPANLYGLSKLLEYVANRTNMPTGELTVFAIAAHVYED